MILFIVAVALLWPVPFTSNQLFAAWKDSDLVVSHWPTALLIQRGVLQQHQLPLWNPYFGGGLPLAANPLAALFYPPTHLVDFLSLRDYYLVLVMGHLVWAGLGMFLLARRAANLPRFPALVAALSYMATPKLLAHLGAGHITMIQTVAWYPWLALACRATMRNPRRWGMFLGICIALTLLAGHPQMAYYGFLMVVGLASWLLVKRWRREGWRAQRAPLTGLGVAVLSGMLLAAIYLLPLLELIGLSSRQTALGVGDVFPILNFLRLLISQPPAGSGWETMVAPGWSVLVLASLAIVTRWRKVWPLVLGIALTAGLAVGNASPLYWLVARILPEFSSFRGVARIWFVALVQLALLAGFGSHVLLGGIQRAMDLLARRRQPIFAFFTAAVSLFIVFVVACSLIVMDTGYTRVNNVSMLATPSTTARTIARLAGSGRVYDVQGNLLQTSAVELSMPLADGQDPLLIESYISYMQQAGGYSMDGYNLRIPYDAPNVQPDARLLGLLHVSIVVSQRPLSDPRLTLEQKLGGTLVYRNTADAGPAYLVAAEPGGNPPALKEIRRLATSVHTVATSDEASTFTFSTGTVAYMVLATTAFPGWTASLDGQVVPVERIAGLLPAIKVGPGTHTLNYSYHPSSVRNGAILSGTGLLLILLWFILAYRSQPGSSRRSQADKAENLQQANGWFRIGTRSSIMARRRGANVKGERIPLWD